MSRSVGIVVICLALTARAGAVTVAPLSFDELVNESTTVVYGRVSDVQGRWSDDRRRIDSLVTIEVVGRYKGSPGETLTFTVPGGQVGPYLNLVPGAPSFARGDRAVLFLTARGPRLPITTGFTQGIYRVTVDARTGSALVLPPAIDAADRRIIRGDVMRKPVPLASFEAAVRAVKQVVR
ncbi:MAG: hypothetical protein Q7R30_23540 [Acidobacteriota bacterium]|nr:hypothetical protein [Acidobacteriota bacterium]